MSLRERLLLAIAEHHSGNADEGERIADAAISVFDDWLTEKVAERHGVSPSEATSRIYLALAQSLNKDTDHG